MAPLLFHLARTDPSYNIPLIVAGGAVAENAINDGFVSQIDLFPNFWHHSLGQRMCNQACPAARST